MTPNAGFNTTPHLIATHHSCYFSLHPSPLSPQISPLLTSEVHSVRAGRHLATKLNILVQQHFDLASTTITNIPMKVRGSLPSVCPCTCLAKLKNSHKYIYFSFVSTKMLSCPECSEPSPLFTCFFFYFPCSLTAFTLFFCLLNLYV